MEHEPQGRTAEIIMERGFFGPKESTIVGFGDLRADLFRYETGVEAIRIANTRGHVTVLP